ANRISPVSASTPITSGSPPVRSISCRDHSLSARDASRASTSAHDSSGWRCMWRSKRVLSASRSGSRSSGGRFFPVVSMFGLLSALLDRSFWKYGYILSHFGEGNHHDSARAVTEAGEAERGAHLAGPEGVPLQTVSGMGVRRQHVRPDGAERAAAPHRGRPPDAAPSAASQRGHVAAAQQGAQSVHRRPQAGRGGRPAGGDVLLLAAGRKP